MVWTLTWLPLRLESRPDPISNPIAYVTAPVAHLVRRLLPRRWKVAILESASPWGSPRIVRRTVLARNEAPDATVSAFVDDIGGGRI